MEPLLRQITEQAEIEGVRVSAHTFARMYLERGGVVYKLSRLMGHTDVKTTEKHLKEFTSREARQQQAPFSPVESLDLTKKAQRKRKA